MLKLKRHILQTRWKLGISLYAHKLSIPRSSSNTFGMGADVSYKFYPKTSLHLFGTYYLLDMKPKRCLDGYHYGGYLCLLIWQNDGQWMWA